MRVPEKYIPAGIFGLWQQNFQLSVTYAHYTTFAKQSSGYIYATFKDIFNRYKRHSTT